MPEAFTSGLVSDMARRSYVEDHPGMVEAFSATRVGGRRGWVMRAYLSQINYARACGRGVASGRGVPIHPFDLRGQQ